MLNLFSRLLGQPAPKTREYHGVKDSLSSMIENTQGHRGALSPLVRFVCEVICENVAAKDYLSETLAIRYWVNQHAPYFRDPKNVEWIRDPQALIEQMGRAAVRAGATPPTDLAQLASLVGTDPRAVVRCDCDEVASLCAALWLCAGNRADFVTAGFGKNPKPHSHVFARCEIPKQPGKFIVCDPVAGTKEAFMLENIRSFDTVRLD